MTAPMLNRGPMPVPLALVLACASPRMGALITSRAARGLAPLDTAWVSLHGARYFAKVAFRAAGQVDLIVPLDVWTREFASTGQSGLAALRGVAVPETGPIPSGDA